MLIILNLGILSCILPRIIFATRVSTSKAIMPTITPGMFSQSISVAATPETEEEDDDKDIAANVSDVYDSHLDSKLIDLPDEIQVKTGEEDQEQNFCERSKLKRIKPMETDNK